MNLGQYRTAIERRSGVAIDSDALDQLVNEALQAIATEYDWPWLELTHTFTTQANKGDYPLPFDGDRIRWVTVDGMELLKRRIIDLDRDGGIFGWAVFAGQLVLSPTPGGASEVLVRYHGDESELSADAQSPSLPAKYDHAVIEFALTRVFDRDDETLARGSPAARRSDRSAKAYDEWIRRMRRGCRRMAGPIAPRVRPGSVV